MKKEVIQEPKEDKATSYGFFILMGLLGFSFIAAIGYLIFALVMG